MKLYFPEYLKERDKEFCVECVQRIPLQYESLSVDYGQWDVAWGYKRSPAFHDDKPGQDYFSMRYNPKNAAIVVADGVSQSFYADIASREVGQALCQYLWELRNSPPAGDNVTVFLNSLHARIDRIVNDKTIPGDLIPVLKEVLSEKQKHGSQTVLGACLLDMLACTARFYLLGNIRITWIDDNKSVVTRTYSDKERWSSKCGCKNGSTVRYWDVENLIGFCLQSDGLGERFPMHLWTKKNFEKVSQEMQDINEDDITFVSFQKNSSLRHSIIIPGKD